MFQRILVPLDGSTRAERALPVAARLARASDGTVVLLRVVSTPIEWRSHHFQPFPEGALQLDSEAAMNYLNTLLSLQDLEGIGVKTKTLPGDAASGILDAAKEEQSDLIVICSHGDTGFKRWFVGSVAQKVARHGPVPVLILHEEGSLPTSSYPDRSRPLCALMGMVALDGSVLAETALLPAASLVAALAAPACGTLLLTRVVTLPGTESKGGHRVHVDPQMREQLLDEATEYLNTVAERLRHDLAGQLDLTITSSVAVGMDVADALIRAAENGEEAGGIRTSGSCSLLALATHGREGVQRLALGSVTERVLGATRLPLLIVRPPERQKPAMSTEQEKDRGVLTEIS